MASQVIKEVQRIREQMPRVGTRKLYHLLQPPMHNLGVGRDKLFTVLRANQMLIKPQRNYRITTQTHHRFRKHKNLVVNMEITQPEQVWVSDITYVKIRDKHCYLSLITDVYSKKIMGYDLSNSLSTESSLRALQMAIRNRLYPERTLIHHSDKGFQYCSNEYQAKLRKYHIQPSMTESYDPYANAVAERVNGILKQEFLLEELSVNIDTMKLLVKDSVRVYNSIRPHLSCLMNTPDYMHKQQRIKIKTYKNSTSCKRTLATC